MIKYGVFIVQFFNTAILLLIVNANASSSGVPLIRLLLNDGQYSDFTAAWYNDIGNTLISAMTFNFTWPLIEFAVFYSLRLLFRLKDRGFNQKDIYRTKTITISSYVDIYSGPEYMIHYKYSSMLNIVFVTFMYGAGLPILFPIALGSLTVLYIMERLLVAYSYKQPPTYDDKLNTSTINVMMYAPVFYSAFGYWMFSNQQIFDNEITFRERLLEPLNL